jgi:hypothetical protein
MKTRGSLYIDPSISDNMKFSAYKYAHQRASLEKLGPKYKWNKPEYIRDWVGAFFCMWRQLIHSLVLCFSGTHMYSWCSRVLRHDRRH